MRILGIDPGLNTTGYAVIDAQARRIRVVEAGVVRGGAGKSLAARLVELHSGLSEVLAAHQPQTLAIEELYSHYDRPRTAILMGHARGTIIQVCAAAGLTVHHYAATQIKKTLTGAGRAPKSQMQAAVARELGLAAPPEPPDVADALAVALTHAFAIRRLPQPDSQRA